MAYILALIVGFGSVGLYMAAFFFPEVYRKNDFVLSGIGMFYALVLWVCAGRMTGGVLIGQMASVTLLGWLAWQSLEMRRSLTPIDQQTRLPGAARTLGEVLRKSAQELPGQLLRQVQRLSLPAALGGLSKRTNRAIGTTPARSPKQLQDGDRSLTPTAKQPRANSVKPAKPARKRPVKPVEPPQPVEQPMADAIAPVSEASELELSEVTELSEILEAIAPPVSDGVTPSDLPIAPEAIRDPRRQASAPDPLPAESPTSAAPEAPLPEALPTPAASDDDFDFDDDITPTRATAAELRQLTAQSAASRRPNWFTTLKLRLQRGRNSSRRSPQPISSEQMVPAPETAPEIAPETAPEIAPEANPEQSAPATAENWEAVEAIATPVEAETLTPSSDSDWDLDWAEDSTASEVAAAAAAEFEGTGFPEPEGSVTITVAAEIIPAIETDPISDSSAAEEWDLGWTQDVAAEFAAESLADVATDSLADVATDSLADFEPESAPEPAAELLAEPVPDPLSESTADSTTDLAAELELDLDLNLDSDIASAEAEWENWAEPAADQPAAVLPPLTEPEIDPISEASNWPDADAIALSPALLELLEQDTDAIAFPTEDFSELLSTIPEPEPIEHPEEITVLEQDEAIAPPPDIDEPPALVDESPTVIDESLSVVDESLTIIDEFPSIVDEFPNVVDEFPSVVDESSSVVDESSSVVDESSNLIDESLSLIDESLSVVDESLNMIDESLSTVDENLKGEFDPTDTTNDTSTQPASRGLTIQIVKLEPSETTPEPPPEPAPEPETPPSYE